MPFSNEDGIFFYVSVLCLAFPRGPGDPPLILAALNGFPFVDFFLAPAHPEQDFYHPVFNISFQRQQGKPLFL